MVEASLRIVERNKRAAVDLLGVAVEWRTSIKSGRTRRSENYARPTPRLGRRLLIPAPFAAPLFRRALASSS